MGESFFFFSPRLFVTLSSCQIRGKKHKDTVCIVVSDEEVDRQKIRMSKVVRTNLRVRLGDMVSLHTIDVPYGVKIKVLPIDDTIEVCYQIY